jgi:hypothetical protein
MLENTFDRLLLNRSAINWRSLLVGGVLPLLGRALAQFIAGPSVIRPTMCRIATVDLLTVLTPLL